VLGPHKLLCADSTIPENLERILGKERIVLRQDDLPYGVGYDQRNHAKDPRKKKARRTFKMIANDDLTGKEHTDWLRKLITAIKPFMVSGAVMYLWNGFHNFGGMAQVLEEEGFCVSNVITWIKDSACPGYSDYKFASEFLLYSWLKNGKHRWCGPPNETNVWRADREVYDTRVLHPTAKPISLGRRILRNSSQRGDIVFDGCMGAGFLLIGCQQMGRIFRGLDLEPAYIDTAVKRYIRTFGVDSVSKEVRAKYFGRDKR
jgi:DNA modification methylase